MILKIVGGKLKTLNNICSKISSMTSKSLLSTLLSLTLFTTQSRNLAIIRPGIIPGMTATTAPGVIQGNTTRQFKAKKYAKAKYSSVKYPTPYQSNKKSKPYLKRTKGFLVYDATNKRIIMEKEANAKIHPASLTKIMTLYSVIRALQEKHVTLDQEIVISQKAASQARIRLDLPVGFRMSLRTALFAMMTVSANDVTYAIGEALFGDQVEKVFNSYAKELGMKNTSFKNCTGLPNPDQVTTAKDLMRLTLEILRNYPRYMEFGSAKQCCCNGRCKTNTNKLLGKYGVTGFKTGVTNASGYHLVTHAKIKNRDIIGVFFGYTSHQERTSHVSKILTSLPTNKHSYNQYSHMNSSKLASKQSADNKYLDNKYSNNNQNLSQTKKYNIKQKNTAQNKYSQPIGIQSTNIQKKTISKSRSVKTENNNNISSKYASVSKQSLSKQVSKRNTNKNNIILKTSKKSSHTIKEIKTPTKNNKTPMHIKQKNNKSLKKKSQKKSAKQSIDNFIQNHLSTTI